MTPKEKAKELVEKYIPFCGMEMTEVQCALIAVDEILDIIRYHGTDIGKHSLLFWQEVKQEIEKL